VSVEPSAAEAVERIDPDETMALELALHVSRYRFVARLVAGRRVLDAGCGIGYGSAEFTSAPPARYLAVDRSSGAIRLAQRRYAAPGRLFIVGDVGALPFDDRQFDVVLSFEVIEHLQDVHRYLAELRRVLHPGGTCVVSTPNKRWFSDDLAAPPNPYHVREYYPAEFARLLRMHFPDVTLMGQHDGARARVVRGVDATYGRFLDRMGLRQFRHLVPVRLRTGLHSLVVSVLSRARGVRPGAIEASDYTFTADGLDDARILVGVCRVP
jgi:SAM-dependent methyltransferase